MCTLALNDVPHSDEMTDDPFRYLARHITAKSQTRIREPPIQPVAVEEKSLGQLTSPQTWGAAGDDTATPSETSKRETLQTNASTPMTTPGVTPGETGKRFSDAARSTTTHPSSNLRTEVKTFKGNAVYSFLKDSFPVAGPQTAAAAKSLTHLPTSTRTKLRQPPPEEANQNTNGLMRNPDFNKSLPALPPVYAPSQPSADTPNKEKPRGLSRVLKTVRLQRTQPSAVIQERSTSSDAPRQIQQVTKDNDSNTKKRRFNITAIFNKHNMIYPKRATVG